jgi:hypothetical protein
MIILKDKKLNRPILSRDFLVKEEDIGKCDLILNKKCLFLVTKNEKGIHIGFESLASNYIYESDSLYDGA